MSSQRKHQPYHHVSRYVPSFFTFDKVPQAGLTLITIVIAESVVANENYTALLTSLVTQLNNCTDAIKELEVNPSRCETYDTGDLPVIPGPLPLVGALLQVRFLNSTSKSAPEIFSLILLRTCDIVIGIDK